MLTAALSARAGSEASPFPELARRSAAVEGLWEAARSVT